MRRMKLYNVMSLLCSLLAVSMSSCVKEDFESPLAKDNDKAVNITISVAQAPNHTVSRAAIESYRTDRCWINRLDIVLTDGQKITKIIPFDENTTELIAPDEFGVTGLVEGSGTFPVKPADGVNTDIKFRISPEDMKNVADIYIVANYINESGIMTTLPLTVGSSISNLLLLKQGLPSGEAGVYCTMFGHINKITNSAEEVTDKYKKYTVELKRTIAMITLAIDGSKLHDGVVITPMQAKLVNVPKTCYISKYLSNKPADVNDIEPKGDLVFQLANSWPPVCNNTTKGKGVADAQGVTPYEFPTPADEENMEWWGAASGPHGTGSLVKPLFMFENMQGTGKAVENQIDKEPLSTEVKDLCSYIEVEASYRHSVNLGGNANIGNLSGKITYKFYLGNNVTDNFDIERNKHYMLTLRLSGWGGLVEEGVINADENYVPNSDLSWRVVTELTQGGGVLNNVMEVPANGSRIDFVLEGYPDLNTILGGGNKYHIVFKNGNNNKIWVKNSQNNTWVENPGNSNAGFYLFDENNDGKGPYLLKIYVKPLGNDQFNGIVTNKALTTVEKWKTDGYTEFSFEFKGFTPATLNDPVTIRQWLPMPVMTPEANGNPNNAPFYFSRFDIYHGDELPWGHSQMVDKDLWDANTGLMTATESLDIWNSFGTESPHQEYTRENGFHKTVAYFATNYRDNTLGEINFNDGLPQTMMAYAFFSAANAEPITGGMFALSPTDAEALTHYGLASKEEWAQIEQYGVTDDNYPILPGTQYWTSTIDNTDGTKNLVYMAGSGGSVTAYKRDQLFKGRMVYYKDAKATPNGVKNNP